MSKTSKQVLFWSISLLMTLAVAVFQRMTGPSHPFKGQEIFGANTVSYSLPRSAETGKSMPLKIDAPGATEATLFYRKVNSLEDWSAIPMTKTNDQFTAIVPTQPPAGKVAYRIALLIDNAQTFINKGNPIVARFRGSVPASLLILHILFMFSSLLFASRCLFSPWEKSEFVRIMVFVTTFLIFIGGMILGPLVQKYAFGHYWTGLPFGSDLTDNKTLFILLIWISVLFLYKKKRYIPGVAAALTLLIYLIPHSVMGSELDYRTGQHKNVYTQTENSPTIIMSEYEPENPA